MQNYSLDYLDQLEAESIFIMREVFGAFKKPVMLYSIGKDSSVMLKLAEKAFYPGKIPFPLLHIDTGYKFKEMIEFRDYYTEKIGAELIVYKNEEEEALKFKPEDAGTDNYVFYRKTKPLLKALKEYGFDAALGGARRDEEKSRAKERVFSVRNEDGVWNPKAQRPELWHLYNSCLADGENMRVFPLSNWTELDVWTYIKRENIEIVPLYFAKKRRLVRRNGLYLRTDEFVQEQNGEEVEEHSARYRSLGCSPATGAVLSEASSLDEIIAELLEARNSERSSRAIDSGSATAMEEKKKEGYF